MIRQRGVERKKLLVVLLIIVIVLSFPAGAIASPSMTFATFDFSDFNELRYMAENATDEELQEFLRHGSNSLGITNREQALEFVDTAGNVFVPVFPDSENVERSSFIRTPWPIDQGPRLVVEFRFPEKYSIRFSTFSRHDLLIARLFGSFTFGSPTADRYEIEYHNVSRPGRDDSDFVILIGDYALRASFQFREGVRLSDEEQLEILKQFSFVRLSDNEEVGNSSARFWHVAFAAAGVTVAVAVVTIIIKRCKHEHRN